MEDKKKIHFQDLGLIDYKKAWDYQEKICGETVGIKIWNRKNESEKPKETKNHFLFCEHPHVFTLGKSGSLDNLLVNETQLNDIGASYYKINRGGDITYHGPGQIVGYPILDLENFFTDIHKYLRFLEEMVILTLADYGIESGRYDGFTGVWLDADNPVKARKICAMGVRCSRWVTMHGFALNANPDLGYFGKIVPCGITDKKVTSMEQELGEKVVLAEVKERLKIHFSNLFEAQFIPKEELINKFSI